MTCLPEEVYADPHVVACTQRFLRAHGSGPPPVPQPRREMLLAALAR